MRRYLIEAAAWVVAIHLADLAWRLISHRRALALHVWRGNPLVHKVLIYDGTVHCLPNTLIDRVCVGFSRRPVCGMSGHPISGQWVPDGRNAIEVPAVVAAPVTGADRRKPVSW